MTKDAKTRFLIKLQELAERLYRHGDSVSHDEEWERRRHFLMGYCDSALTISLVTQEEIQKEIDSAHFSVFGEERLLRINRLGQIHGQSCEPDWAVFDEPTYQRKGD